MPVDKIQGHFSSLSGSYASLGFEAELTDLGIELTVGEYRFLLDDDFLNAIGESPAPHDPNVARACELLAQVREALVQPDVDPIGQANVVSAALWELGYEQ